MFKGIKLSFASDRLREEKLYAQVIEEIEQGVMRPGLWAKALSESDSNEGKTRARYIELRVQSLKDEYIVTQKLTLQAKSEVQKEAQREAYVTKCDLKLSSNDENIQRLIAKAKHKRSSDADLSVLCIKLGIKLEKKKRLLKNYWVIFDQSDNRFEFDDSANLELFLVECYEHFVSLRIS